MLAAAMTPPAAEPAAATAALTRLAERWAGVKASERANYQLYLGELCAALGVEGPRPAGSGYEYEFPVKVLGREGNETSNFVDLFKRDHFVLEAKDGSGGADAVLLRKAYGQARSYVTHLPGKTPPYVMVLDVGKTLLVWDRWEGGFGGFSAARRIDLPSLAARPADVALLQDIWREPERRDPRAKSQAITVAIAGKLARLAASLEARGHGQEPVSRFLMRCVFTMFAEDVRLLHDEPFRRLVDEVALPSPDEFVPAVEELWRAMDHGHRFGFRKLLRFNGHFFKDATALPLTHSRARISPCARPPRRRGLRLAGGRVHVGDPRPPGRAARRAHRRGARRQGAVAAPRLPGAALREGDRGDHDERGRSRRGCHFGTGGDPLAGGRGRADHRPARARGGRAGERRRGRGPVRGRAQGDGGAAPGDAGDPR